MVVADPREALQQRVALLRVELLHVHLAEVALGHGEHGRPRAVVGGQLLERRPPQGLLVVVAAAPAPRGRQRGEDVAGGRPHRSVPPQAPQRVYLPGVVHPAAAATATPPTTRREDGGLGEVPPSSWVPLRERNGTVGGCG